MKGKSGLEFLHYQVRPKSKKGRIISGAYFKEKEMSYKVKIRPYLTREEILEDINTLILLARDNNFSVLEKELVELEEELKIE